LLHTFLISLPGGGEWPASRPGRFTPGNISRYPLNRGWVGFRPSLDAVAKRKKFHHCSSTEMNPGRPAHTDWATPVTKMVTLLSYFLLI